MSNGESEHNQEQTVWGAIWSIRADLRIIRNDLDNHVTTIGRDLVEISADMRSVKESVERLTSGSYFRKSRMQFWSALLVAAMAAAGTIAGNLLR